MSESLGPQPVVVTGIGNFDGDAAVSLLQGDTEAIEEKLDTIIELLQKLVAQKES